IELRGCGVEGGVELGPVVKRWIRRVVGEVPDEHERRFDGRGRTPGGVRKLGAWPPSIKAVAPNINVDRDNLGRYPDGFEVRRDGIVHVCRGRALSGRRFQLQGGLVDTGLLQE